MESNTNNNQLLDIEDESSKSRKKFLLALNCIILTMGTLGASPMARLYFIKGGKSLWLSSALETAGWPFILLLLTISYLYRRSAEGSLAKIFHISPRLFVAFAVLGLLTGVVDFLYSFGVAFLPLSTSALIISSQLGFTAGFAFILVKQKFTSYTINAIFLLSLGSVVLALHAASDRPTNESNAKYFLGFFMTLGAAMLFGFVLPAIELTYNKAKQNISYAFVLESQLIMYFFATAVCCIGMAFHNDFESIPREASEYELGEAKYYMVLVFGALFWQFFFVGAVGVTYSGSSLLSEIIITALLPLQEIFALLVYHEKFHVEKAIALILSLWGFTSYFYGEFQHQKEKRKAPPLEVP